MNYFKFLIALIVVTTSQLVGQTIATTESGSTVVLFDDGSYKSGHKAKTESGDSVILFYDGTFFRLKNNSIIPSTFDTAYLHPDLGINKIQESKFQGLSNKESSEFENDNELETVQFIRASFAGGDVAFRNYVASEFEFPVLCLEDSINYSVTLKFLVDTKGRISKITPLNETEGCPQFTEEAIRIINRSPRWIPGQRNGRFCISWREIEIHFPLK